MQDLPLLGRAAEVAMLGRCRAAAIAGSPQLVLISGEAGMGRSSLVRAFLLGLEGPGKVVRARCMPMLRSPYGALAHVLQALLGCDLDAPAGETSAALDRHLARFPDAADMRGLIGHMLRLGSDHPAIAGLSPGALRAAALSAVADLLDRLAAGTSLVIVVEDLQWADPGSAEWLVQYCRRLSLGTAPQRVLIVATFTDGGIAPPLDELLGLAEIGASRFGRSHLALRPLGLQASLDLVAACLGQKPATWPPALRSVAKQILDKAQGHPAYVVETVEALTATGLLRRNAAGEWRVAQDGVAGVGAERNGDAAGGVAAPAEPAGGAVNLPATVGAALAARLAAFPGQVREQLQLAAIAGSRFGPGLVGTVLGEALTEALNELARLRLLAGDEGKVVAGGPGGDPGGGPRADMQRGHASLSEAMRSAALASMSAEGRQGLHAKVGEALEALLGDQAPRFAAELALHFEEAHDAEKAYKYLCLQAGQAAATGLAAEAASLLDSALRWSAAIEDWSRAGEIDVHQVRLDLATALTQIGEFDRALAALDAAEADRPLNPAGWRARGQARERSGDLVGALDAMYRAVKLAGGDGKEGGRSLLAVADIQRRTGKIPEAIATVEQAGSYLDAAGTPAEDAMRHGLLGLSYFRQGDFAAARPHHEEALRIRSESCDLEGQANSLNNLGILACSEKRYADAEGLLGRAFQLFCKLGNRPGAAMVLNNLGDVYVKQGRDKLAEARLLEAQAIADQLGYESERITSTANLAEVFLLRGNHAEALRLLDRCLAMAVRASIREFIPEIHRARGRTFLAAGDHAQAAIALREAEDLDGRPAGT